MKTDSNILLTYGGKKLSELEMKKRHTFSFLCLINSVKQINRAGTVPASQQKVWELISSNRMENRFVEWLSYNTCYLGITQYKCARLA